MSPVRDFAPESAIFAVLDVFGAGEYFSCGVKMGGRGRMSWCASCCMRSVARDGEVRLEYGGGGGDDGDDGGL